ncbi:DUF4317 family protein [Paenalkalicoccus suaedae]|uniref:DUF4317 family protein n=1 Tax=Paenalkalicoccus suaedae TaxID=2592382 RepID=A0A859FCH3_9BACI|nr:DUF4317 family protein [Paenalkalicoccus suaedae]QKS69916.1 DUF4317 family protein [Paenalkalicoccus suaedae]
MDKKDIAAIRRQFKSDNQRLRLHDIFTLYVMKDSTDIYHAQNTQFEMLEREQQELYLQNFKKVLGGRLDEKLFELKFKQDTTSQLVLHKGLLSKDAHEWQSQMVAMTERMLKDRTYDTDIVITFVRGDYYISAGQRGPDSGQDAMYTNAFLLSTINKTEEPDREMQFDYVKKEFTYTINVDPVIDLKHPLGGFLFPAITDGSSDVNRVLYAAGKNNEPDYAFIEEVLEGEDITTAIEDKTIFEEVVKEIVGPQVSPTTLATVYGEINRLVEENETESTPILDYKDVDRVLRSSGQEVSEEQVKAAFQNVTTEETYELKAANIVPRYTSKSIKIKTKVADISISPQDLQYVRQVNYDGKRCLMIDIDEDAELDGFRMLPEAFGQKVETE